MAEQWARHLGGRIARLWNTYGWESPDARSHVVTDLVLAGLRHGRVRAMTDGHERRRFIYKTDCVAALIELFDGNQQTADISGPEWLTIRRVAEEIGRQLDAEVEFGEMKGSEAIIDPKHTLPGWQPRVSFSEGISRVITDARAYLKEQGTTESGH
jgi:nucleoside-diphosphate-sugar epimerase